MATGIRPYIPMPIPVTGIYGALYGLLLLGLALLVVRQRRRSRTAFGEGDGDARGLRRAIRAQGNAVENVPISLLLLALCELEGMSGPLLHFWGAGLLVARVAHATALSRTEGVHPLRTFGAGFQFLFLLALPLWLLAHLGGFTS